MNEARASNGIWPIPLEDSGAKRDTRLASHSACGVGKQACKRVQTRASPEKMAGAYCFRHLAVMASTTTRAQTRCNMGHVNFSETAIRITESPSNSKFMHTSKTPDNTLLLPEKREELNAIRRQIVTHQLIQEHISRNHKRHSLNLLQGTPGDIPLTPEEKEKFQAGMRYKLGPLK